MFFSDAKGIICSVMFVIIAVIAVIGNIIVVVTICSRRSMHTAINIFIVSMAIGDILLAIFSVPLRPIWFLQITWPLGTVGCKIFRMFNVIAISATPITLIAISIILFKLRVCPKQKPFTKREAVIIAIGIWILNLFVTLPEWIFNKVLPNEVAICGYTEWPVALNSISLEPFYRIFIEIWNFFAPAVFLIVTYAAILMAASYSVDHRTNGEVNDFKLNRKMTKIMMVVSIVHLLCWTAYSLSTVYVTFHKQLWSSLNTHMLIDWVTLLSTACKPVIYFVMSAGSQSAYRKHVYVVDQTGWL